MPFRRYVRPADAKKNIQISLVDNVTMRVSTHKIPIATVRTIAKHFDAEVHKKHFDMPYHKLNDLRKYTSQWTIETPPPCIMKCKRVFKPEPFDHTKIPAELWSTLYSYQKKGVEQAISVYQSRVLLADDMGLGKTMQGIAFIGYHLPKRTLIICPSYLRLHWRCTMMQWLNVSAKVIKKGTDALDADICVVSYDLMDRLGVSPGLFDVILLDESHYLKSRKTKRTKSITPLVKAAPFVMLLTGTPALNRPIELFSQLHMLRPAYIKNYTMYAKRYCNGKRTHFGFDDRGSSNLHELSWVLRKRFMIRRLKRDVLTELPAKTRYTKWLDIGANMMLEVTRGFDRWRELNQNIYRQRAGSEAQRKMMFERKTVISEIFRATATAKCEAVVQWITDALQRGESFIFFAYHRVLLNAVETAVGALGVNYMRIDGSTTQIQRQANVDAFQSDPSIRIAILSIMAAGTGVTLTRVSTCVFGELFWVPGVMIQAEDRVHRISQQNPVQIKYLLGTDTMDTYVHPALCKKLALIDQCIDQRSDRTFQGVDEDVDEEESLLKTISRLI